jgi:hypothetical protein
MGCFEGRRARQKSTPDTRKDLIEQMSELWSIIEPDFRGNLSNSMLKRLYQVITNKGKATSYKIIKN